MANIGFIGLGIMGTPMAINLKKGDHQLFLFSRSGVKEKALLEVGEALLFASKAGADPARVRQALMGEFANSCIANGLAKSDHAAMVSALELLANHSIAHESANS
jgi:3-hydroxyisobutyrate dehydrogenase-like beta-hydroxyacid dehydrogenase